MALTTIANRRRGTLIRHRAGVVWRVRLGLALGEVRHYVNSASLAPSSRLGVTPRVRVEPASGQISLAIQQSLLASALGK